MRKPQEFGVRIQTLHHCTAASSDLGILTSLRGGVRSPASKPVPKGGSAPAAARLGNAGRAAQLPFPSSSRDRNACHAATSDKSDGISSF